MAEINSKMLDSLIEYAKTKTESISVEDIRKEFPAIFDNTYDYEICKLQETVNYLIEREISFDELLKRLESKLTVIELYNLSTMCPVQLEGEDEYGREVYIRIRWQELIVYLDHTPIYSCRFEDDRLYANKEEFAKDIRNILNSIGFQIRKDALFIN